MSNTTNVLCLACLLVGGAAGWFARGAPSEAPESELQVAPEEPSPAGGDAGLQAGAEVAAAIIEQLKQQLDTVAQERDSLKQALAEVEAEQEGAQDEASRIAAAVALKGPRYTYEEMQKALSDMNWKRIAESVVGMAEPMRELGEALSKGLPPGDLPQKIQKYNMPLIQAAVAAGEGGLKGHGINGSFTHPAMIANMVYATLVEAGQPLDEVQVEKLGQLADRFVEEDRRLRASQNDESFAMEQLVLESEMKDRFYKAVDGILTQAQIDILHPASLRDRTAGDIFSAGLIWMQNAQVARVTGRDDLAQKITAGLVRRLQASETEQEAVGQAVGDWAARFGDEAFTPLDDLEKNNMVRMDRIRAAGRPMVELYKEIVRSLPSDSDAAKRAKASAFLVVPAGR